MQYSQPDIITIIAVLVALLVIAFALIIWLHIRMKKLLSGDAQSIEETLVAVKKDIQKLSSSKEKVEKTLLDVDRRLKRSIQGVGTVRFNPFKGTSGSNQSFVTAFLSEEGDGVALSSLYSRDRVSVFAKPIKNRSSEYELTDEEKEAIAHATHEK